MTRNLLIVVGLMAASGTVVGQENKWFVRQTEWNGYQQFHFSIGDRDAYVVAPNQVAQGKPWVWRARFPGYHAEMDIQLLGDGYHIGYVDVAGLFGSPKAVEIGDRFYEYVVSQIGLSPRPALEGVSRGGLFVYNWTARNLDKVACIYCDTPVLDFHSWPGGFGDGVGAAAEWSQCLRAYELTEDAAIRFREQPIDFAPRIAEARIPLLHIVSENDRIVPPAENTYLLKSRLADQGHTLEVISVSEGTEKSKGHHFTHPDPERVVRFIKRHSLRVEQASSSEEVPERRDGDSSGQERDETASEERMALLRDSQRIVFLGDSITYAGGYVAHFDTWLQTLDFGSQPVVFDVGLPSETVSGLSEDGHAGGRFPRPDLAERLERVLAITKPDLVFACYGINCGIYQPFDDERLRSYQDGIRRLRRAVEETGATLVLVTPPSFDDLRAGKDFSYNGVLDRYSDWLLKQREKGWLVIDLHHPMSAELARRREADPEFTFQPDAVHPNEAGHWYIATQIMNWFGDRKAAEFDSLKAFSDANEIEPETAQAIRERLNLRRDAYLTAAGHKRPGVRAGLPIEEAEAKASDLTRQIENH